MRPIPDRSLWLGHAGDLHDASALMKTGIEAVVELADSEPMALLPRELIRCRFPISDDGNNPPWLLRMAVRTSAALVSAAVPTLICCSAGQSRSVCIAACGIALAEGLPLPDALAAVVRSGPADISPGLLVSLRDVLDQEGTARPQGQSEIT